MRRLPGRLQPDGPQPLKIGLGEELMALAGVHPALADLTRTRIRQALRVYTGMPAYRQALARGGPRYDLDGQPVGEITPDPQADARRPHVRPSPAPAETPASPRPRHPSPVTRAPAR